MRQRQWLLIKHRDQAASNSDITAVEFRSAASGRTLAEIARRDGASARQLKQAEDADRTAASPGAAWRLRKFALDAKIVRASALMLFAARHDFAPALPAIIDDGDPA